MPHTKTFLTVYKLNLNFNNVATIFSPMVNFALPVLIDEITLLWREMCTYMWICSSSWIEFGVSLFLIGLEVALSVSSNSTWILWCAIKCNYLQSMWTSESKLVTWRACHFDCTKFTVLGSNASKFTKFTLFRGVFA